MTTADDTLIATGERNVLRMERRYPHPPEKVWRAITEPAHLSAWFPFGVELELRPGGAMRFGVEDDPVAGSGVVTELDEPRLFAFDWGGSILRFELEPDGDAGCRLVFTHTFDDRYGAASFASGWRTCLRALDAVLGGREPDPPEDINALHERYVEQFDLARAVVIDRGPDGWTIRLERQLTQPAERVWELLVGEEEAVASAAPIAGAGAAPGAGASVEPGAGASVEPGAGAAPPARAMIEPVAAGEVLAAEAPRLLEYAWLAAGGRRGGRVRWELVEGTGHGARLVLTQTGSIDDAADLAAVRAAWEERVEQLATQLAAEPRLAR